MEFTLNLVLIASIAAALGALGVLIAYLYSEARR
jgi:hypothetical protein